MIPDSGLLFCHPVYQIEHCENDRT